MRRLDGYDCGLWHTKVARFLCSEAVVAADGRVRSWVNATHPGYFYDEAAALWLLWASWRMKRYFFAVDTKQMTQVFEHLQRQISVQGGLGKDDRVYLFDTCVGIDALAEAAQVLGTTWDASAAKGRLEQFVRRGVAVIGGQSAQRWSEHPGTHLLKAVALLLRASKLIGGELDRFAIAVLGLIKQDAFQENYCHAIAYAAEGACLAQAIGLKQDLVDPMDIALRLKEIQRPDGAVPQWADGSGPGRADATAQAVRLWCAVGREVFDKEIERGVGYLTAQTAHLGGLFYGEDSLDVNVWATIFADQALTWAIGGASVSEWI